MATVNETKIIEVNLYVNKKPTWVRAFVTFEDEKTMRVTPIDGDPMYSINIDKSRGKGELYRDA